MTTPDDLINRDLIQLPVNTKYFYYDVDKDEKIELAKQEALYQEICFIYAKDDILYIEVSQPD
ncbi:MAG: hypothetical protein IJD68_07585 [Ruminococcus sp.]|nr:hypothetical protein [Ruminococcus sp.]MBQ4129616.1 hypothetical protein [Ruminococcus sp.]